MHTYLMEAFSAPLCRTNCTHSKATEIKDLTARLTLPSTAFISFPSSCSKILYSAWPGFLYCTSFLTRCSCSLASSFLSFLYSSYLFSCRTDRLSGIPFSSPADHFGPAPCLQPHHYFTHSIRHHRLLSPFLPCSPPLSHFFFNNSRFAVIHPTSFIVSFSFYPFSLCLSFGCVSVV